MRCRECKQPAPHFWEFIEGIVCEDCILDDPDLLHMYNLYLYDEQGNQTGDPVSANMVIDVRRNK